MIASIPEYISQSFIHQISVPKAEKMDNSFNKMTIEKLTEEVPDVSEVTGKCLLPIFNFLTNSNEFISVRLAQTLE
jgi:hypothetical protein